MEVEVGLPHSTKGVIVMKRFACYLNPWYDLKVMTVYGTLSDMPHYKRARMALIFILSLVSILVKVILECFR